jgi:AsmA protein
VNKILKYGLIAAALATVAVAAITTYIAATFDPNAYKPQLVEWVKEKTRRTLTLPGNIELTLLPSVGVTVGRATLSEPGSDDVFAAVDELRVSLGLLPLLNKQVRVDDLSLRGLQANLVRSADGRWNVDDLLGTPAPPAAGTGGAAPPPVKTDFAIDSVSLANGAVSYRDEKTGASYAVSDLNLKTGRIANSRPSTIDLSGRVQSAAPKMDLTMQGKGGFTIDFDGQRLALKDVALEAKGNAAEVTNLAAKLRGSADMDVAASAVEVAMLAFDATGNHDQDAIELDVALPRLRLAKDGASGEQVVVKAALRRADGTAANANLAVPKLEVSTSAFHAANAALDVEAVQPGQTLKATLTGPVQGRFAEGAFELAQVSVSPLGVQATLSGPEIPNQSVGATLEGSATVDVAQQKVHADLAGVFDQSTIKAKVGVAGFSPPGYTFDVDIDKLDLTRYRKPKPAATAPAPGAALPAAAPAPEAPIDLSALRNLNANGSIRIGALTAPKLKATNVRIEVKAQDGRVNIDPMAANLYGGSVNGAISVDARDTPQFTVEQNLAGVSVGPLLVDLANFHRLEGHGNFSMNVSTTGETVSALKKGLNGTATANLSDGAIRGIDIAATIREAKATIRQLKGKPVTEAADTTQKTDFSTLKATFTLRNGIASNRDLTGTSPVLRLAGEGDIDLGNDRMNYLLKANLVESVTGQSGKERIQVAAVTVPVRVTGPLAAPTYTIDFAAIAAGVAEQAIQDQLQKKLGVKLPEGLPGDILQDAVKGLFKR